MFTSQNMWDSYQCIVRFVVLIVHFDFWLDNRTGASSLTIAAVLLVMAFGPFWGHILAMAFGSALHNTMLRGSWTVLRGPLTVCGEQGGLMIGDQTDTGG